MSFLITILMWYLLFPIDLNVVNFKTQCVRENSLPVQCKINIGEKTFRQCDTVSSSPPTWQLATYCCKNKVTY